MWKWIKHLFGFGEIKSVAAIMAPLIKTRDELMEANAQRKEAIADNIKAIEAINTQNKVHSQEAHLSNIMLEGLESQLKPLDALRESK